MELSVQQEQIFELAQLQIPQNVNKECIKFSFSRDCQLRNCVLCGIYTKVHDESLELHILVQCFTQESQELCTSAPFCSVCLQFIRKLKELYKSSLKTTQEMKIAIEEIFKLNTAKQGQRPDTLNGSRKQDANLEALDASEKFVLKEETDQQNAPTHRKTQRNTDEIVNKSRSVRQTRIPPCKKKSNFQSRKTQRGYNVRITKKQATTCYFCKKRHQYRPQLERHLRTHTCEIAEEDIMMREQLRERNARKRVVYGIRTIKCYFCPKASSALVYLARHMRLMHTMERERYDCGKCGKSFRHKKQWQHHSILVCGIDKEAKKKLMDKRREQRRRYLTKKAEFFKCYFCGKQLTSNHSLLVHLRTHTAEGESFNCKVCGKGFVAKRFLDEHEVLVCGTDPAKEAEYRKRVAQKNARQKQKRAKYRKCENCSKEILQGSVASHQRNCNKKLKERRLCSICDVSFSTWQDKLVHDRKLHDDKRKVWECYFCQKPFLIRFDLYTHLVTHILEKFYKCNVCGKRFKWVHGLKFHRKNKVCEQAKLVASL